MTQCNYHLWVRRSSVIIQGSSIYKPQTTRLSLIHMFPSSFIFLFYQKILDSKLSSTLFSSRNMISISFSPHTTFPSTTAPSSFNAQLSTLSSSNSLSSQTFPKPSTADKIASTPKSSIFLKPLRSWKGAHESFRLFARWSSPSASTS